MGKSSKITPKFFKLAVVILVILATILVELVFIYFANVTESILEKFSLFLIEHPAVMGVFFYIADRIHYIMFSGFLLVIGWVVYISIEDSDAENVTKIMIKKLDSNLASSILAIIGIIIALIFGIMSVIQLVN